jgi:hypothetical protein
MSLESSASHFYHRSAKWAHMITFKAAKHVKSKDKQRGFQDIHLNQAKILSKIKPRLSVLKLEAACNLQWFHVHLATTTKSEF